MDRFYQIIGVIVRITAIFIVIRTISYFPNLFAFTVYETETVKLYIFTVLYILLVLGIALVLWKFPLIISRKIVPEVKTEDKITDVAFEQVQVGLISILGIGIIVFSLSDLLYWYSYLQALKAASDPGFPIGPGIYASLYSSILELMLGILLVLGSKGIVGLVTKLRYAGLNKK